MKRSFILMAIVATLVSDQGFAHTSKKEGKTLEPKSLSKMTSESQIEIKKYWARPGKKGQNSAAYMILQNHSDKMDVALVKASSPICREVQIHTTLDEEIDGQIIKKMRQVPEIPLPAHQDVSLKPGGYHIMLISLHENVELDKEKTIPVSLTFNNGESIDLDFPIQKSPCSCCEEAAKKAAAEKA